MESVSSRTLPLKASMIIRYKWIPLALGVVEHVSMANGSNFPDLLNGFQST